MNVDEDILYDSRVAYASEEHVVVHVVAEVVDVETEVEILCLGCSTVYVDLDSVVGDVFDETDGRVGIVRSRLLVTASHADVIGLALLELNLAVVGYVDSTLDLAHDACAGSRIAIELAVVSGTRNCGNYLDEFLFGHVAFDCGYRGGDFDARYRICDFDTRTRYEGLRSRLVLDIGFLGIVVFGPVRLYLGFWNHRRSDFHIFLCDCANGRSICTVGTDFDTGSCLGQRDVLAGVDVLNFWLVLDV